MRTLVALLGSGVVMGALDALWLTLMGPRLYRPAIGELLAPRPDMRAAIAFYIIYVLGIVFLAVTPALREGSALRALAMGAALGFVAYATYDLTNQATLRGWPLHLTLVDVAWGTVLTAASAWGGYWLASRVG
ncbi:MAG: DUF2177 family protein [Brevundimonas sp.]|uniref:DUF2177 family protein n=1 Tax=Brevundimonas sp. TaxID=1871086 RepID=UPI0017B2E6F7|nr:DUF2177 family protein [Brevundimonas sp.]MBA4805701.1 DUF2177 family protein [Brevundimonas sp.]